MNKTAIRNIPLADIMQQNVVTLSTEDTVDKAHEIFKNNGFHHIPVVDEDSKVVGMISTSDLERISLGMSVFKSSKKRRVQFIYLSLPSGSGYHVAGIGSS